MSFVLHVNGWPGCGKLTIARRIASAIGGRLLDNHTLLNPAAALFDRAAPEFTELRRELKRLVFEYALKLAPQIPLVLTDALADIPSDRAVFDGYRELARARGAELVCVVLDCSHEENARRIVAPGRSEQYKLASGSALAELRRQYTLLRAPDLETIECDVTTLDPDAAAAAIVARLRAV